MELDGGFMLRMRTGCRAISIGFMRKSMCMVCWAFAVGMVHSRHGNLGH